jgi:hypothetical protein
MGFENAGKIINSLSEREQRTVSRRSRERKTFWRPFPPHTSRAALESECEILSSPIKKICNCDKNKFCLLVRGSTGSGAKLTYDAARQTRVLETAGKSMSSEAAKPDLGVVNRDTCFASSYVTRPDDFFLEVFSVTKSIIFSLFIMQNTNRFFSFLRFCLRSCFSAPHKSIIPAHLPSQTADFHNSYLFSLLLEGREKSTRTFPRISSPSPSR